MEVLKSKTDEQVKNRVLSEIKKLLLYGVVIHYNNNLLDIFNIYLMLPYLKKN